MTPEHMALVTWLDGPHIPDPRMRLAAAAAIRALAGAQLDWSLARRILEQGMAIQQDYAAGKYSDYEELSARLDAAARERVDALSADQPRFTDGHGNDISHLVEP